MTIKKEFKIGIFVIVVIIATVFVINFLRGADLFGKEITISGHFDDAHTLVASSPVKIRGYAAGRVDKVEYCPASDDFIVSCSIDKRFKIPEDSRMVIFSTSIMGGKGIRIDLGDSENLVFDGGTLSTGTDGDLFETLGSMIAPTFGKLSDLADSLSVTISGINGVMSKENSEYLKTSLAHLKATLANAHSLSAALEGKSDKLKELVDNLDAVSEKLIPFVDSAGIAVGNINAITGQLKDSKIDRFVSDVDSTVINVNDAILKIKGPLDDLLNDADSLVNAIKSNPKKYIKITVF